MIEVSGVKKYFDDFCALNGVSIHVNRGSIYGLVGSNGAGKTTLINHIAGIYRQDVGVVLVDGQPVFENAAVKERVAFVPSQAYYYRSSNIMEMAKLRAALQPRFSFERFEQLQQVFDLNPKANINRMSLGMKKQVAFWLALSQIPDVMLLDEPLDGLDPIMRRQIWSLILSDVAEREMTVLVSSHNLRELEGICDHIGMMHKGSMIAERDISDLTGSLEDFFIEELGGADYEIKNLIL